MSCSGFFIWISSGFKDCFTFFGIASFSSITIGYGLVDGLLKFKSVFEGVRDALLEIGLNWQSLTKSSEIGSSFGF